ncbi:DEAD/DEAH box helicase [Mariniluteicoccus endophyticus]
MSDDPALRHHHRRPASAGRTEPLPGWVPPPVTEALARQGIERLWTHQRRAVDAARAGRHVALSTGTASGKSLAYLLPVLAATWGGEPVAPPPVPETGGTAAARVRQFLARPHTALYLAPTKALAHDQLRSCRDLGLDTWRVTTVDGDSDTAERAWARDHAAYVLTNPDMLHRSILPNHERWGGLLRSLRYVVIDEAHRYRGVFGSHTAQVVRRLRRLCRAYGSDPVFVCASATTANPREAMAALVGLDEDAVELVDEDASPHGALDLALWKAEGHHDTVTADLLTRFVGEGRQTLAFVASRHMVEVVARRAREEMGSTIASYRGGYLPSERRATEAGLQSGELTGVATTNALELGVDIAGMDAVVVSGYPGTLSALWQRVGRAGRSGEDAVAVLVGRDDPLDTWLFDHPDQIVAAPVERSVINPHNRLVVARHLAAAAQEIPCTADDEQWFGPQTVPLLDQLADSGVLRKRLHGWFWTRPDRAVDAIDLRSIGGKALEIVDRDTGGVVGTVDPAAADRTVHPEAVYVHAGDVFVVDELDRSENVAFVRRDDPGYTTQAQDVMDVSVIGVRRDEPCGAGHLRFGDVTLTIQVTGYLRRDARTGDVWDETPLAMAEHRMTTHAIWWTLPEPALAGLGFSHVQLGAAAHALEHTLIGLLAAFVPSDRWDVGGLSTALHPDTGQLTIFVHEGLPGGTGVVEAGFDVAYAWLSAAGDRLERCPCASGCPSCVISPKCGNGNQALDKAGALRLANLLLG